MAKNNSYDTIVMHRQEESVAQLFGKIAYRPVLAALILVISSVFIPPCLAANKSSTFLRLQFGNDVSIEVPRNWKFLNQNTMQNLNTYSEAVVKFAGIDANQGDNQILVAANAYTNDKKPSATMRLSVRVGSFQSQDEIKFADSTDLRREAEKTLRKLNSNLPDNVSGMKLLDVRLERLGEYYTIVTDKKVDYVSGPELDRLDVIYVGDKVYKLNTSYRESEAWMFKPIIRHIRNSLKISIK
jgi:hypothetical protein